MIHAERLSFVFDFEKREYARANFIIYFDISVILSVVFFCVTFLIYFIFFLQIPNTTKNTHKSQSFVFIFTLLFSQFIFCFLYLFKFKSNQHTRFFSHIGRKTLIVIFVINKQARAQARAKTELSRAEHTHARTYEQSELGHPSRMRPNAHARSAKSARTRFVIFLLFYNKQASAKTQLVSWHTIISISVRSSFVLYFSVKKKHGKKRSTISTCCV